MSLPFGYLVMSYLSGSIPSSYVVGRVFFQKDLRQLGSGNLGTTNTLRIFGKKAAFVVLIMDIMKGLFPVWYVSGQMVSTGGEHWVLLCGLAAIIGHIYSWAVGFKGGKGVATSCGVLLALAPLPAVAALVVWIIVFGSTKTASVASLVSSILFPIAIYFDSSNQNPSLFWFSLGLLVLIIWTHRSNIARLIEGKEKAAL